MRSAKSRGRLIGLLLLLQLVGLSVPFIISMPGTRSGFLENAAPIAAQIRLAVLLLLANGALTLGISLVAFPLIRKYSEVMALCFVAMSVIWLSIQAIDNAHILSMLSLSQRYAEGGGANAEQFSMLAQAALSTRRYLHYTELLVIDAWFFMFYFLLFRFSFVPRLLTGFGLAMVAVHLAAIPLPVFLDYQGMPLLAFSLLASHIALASWLVVKGMKERAPHFRAEQSAALA